MHHKAKGKASNMVPVLRYANFYDAQPGQGFGPRYICDFQFLVVQAGTGTAIVGGRTHAIATSDVIFYGPNVQHQVVSSAHDPLRLIGLHMLFHEQNAAQLLPNWERAQTQRYEFRTHRHLPTCPLQPAPPAICSPGGPSPIRRHAEALVLSYLASPTQRMLEKRGLLLLFLQAWIDTITAHEPNHILPAHHRQAVLLVQQLIMNNLRQPPSPTDLAKEVQLSPAYLSRIFKQHVGLGMRGFANEQRMLHARRLLVEGKLNVGQVAIAVGIDDPFYFSRAFSKTFGISPSILRSQHQIV